MNKHFLVIIVVFWFINSGFVYADCRDLLNEVLFGKSCTKIRTYKSKSLSKTPILLVALHGDTAPWNFSSQQNTFAKNIASNNSNVIAVGMLRPRYVDSDKRISDGVQGEGVGDNYDEKRVRQIAGSIQRLKQYHHASRVILVGQSGGAATAANLIALHPGLVNHAFLLACPCNINEWRKDMFERTKKSVFEGDLNTTSPIDIIEDVSTLTFVSLFSGKSDKVVKSTLIGGYASALKKAEKNVELLTIEGNHEIFFKPQVFERVSIVIHDYSKYL